MNIIQVGIIIIYRRSDISWAFSVFLFSSFNCVAAYGYFKKLNRSKLLQFNWVKFSFTVVMSLVILTSQVKVIYFKIITHLFFWSKTNYYYLGSRQIKIETAVFFYTTTWNKINAKASRENISLPGWAKCPYL